jgi:hypothetical protein
MRRLLLLCASLVTISAWTAGCTPEEKEEEDGSATSIDVGPANPSVVIGETIQLTATAIFADAPSEDITNAAVWNTTTSAIATVDNLVDHGLVTAHAVGTVRISATSDLRTGSTIVTVLPAPFDEVEPNDEFPLQANDVGDLAGFRGTVDEVDVGDLYTASVDSGTFSISLAWTEGTPPEDLDLLLYDFEGNFLDGDETIPDDMTVDSPAEVSAILSSATTVYFQILLYTTGSVPYVGTITYP